MNVSRLSKNAIATRSRPTVIAGRAIRSASSNAVISAHAPGGGQPAVDSAQGQGLLSGLRIAVKDNISAADLPTTCASGALRGYVSPRDATVVRLLRDEGAVIHAKTNMDEFGMGSHSVNSAFGPVLNVGPDGESYSAGGSSGGSAVSVVEGDCWASLGTDTGGSIRLPAAFTGVFGFKPSYGLVSRSGVVAYANSLDTVGVLADSTSKIRQMMSVISRFDGRDPTSLPETARKAISLLPRDQRPWRIGVPSDYNIAELDPAIRKEWTRTLDVLQKLGHSIIPVQLPSTKHALSAYYILAPAEASSNLAKYDGVRYGYRSAGSDAQGSTLYSTTRTSAFGPEVRRRILLGTYTLSSLAADNYFVQAQKIRRLVQMDFDRVFSAPNILNGSKSDSQKNGIDVLVCPTAPILPPKLVELMDEDPVDVYKVDVFTAPASLAGLPAMSVPLRADGAAGNVGMQIIGQYGMDDTVLDVAGALEAHGLAEVRSSAFP